MKPARLSTLQVRQQRSRTFVLSVLATALLSACGAGTTENMEQSSSPAAPVASAGPSVSAAELNSDSTNSLSFAQAVAAGVVSRPQLANGDTPIISAANPLALVPTTDTADAEATDQGNTANGVENTINPEPVTGATDNTGDQQAQTTDGNTDQEADPTAVSTDQLAELTDLSTDQVAESDNSSTDAGGASVDAADTSSNEAVTDNLIMLNERDVTNNENYVTDTQFASNTSPGFNGEVLDDAIRVTWPVDPQARGYNVYRQAEFVTSVFTNEYIDEDVFDRDYYYEIQAFDNDDTLYYIATGLTVSARTLGRTDPNQPIPDPDLLADYELVFADEFNGTELDTTKWNTSYLWGTDLIINNEEQYYVDINNEPDFGFNPFSFDGESLTISSIKTPENLLSKSLNQPYLSGVITSYDAFKFTYGYVETRAKMTFGRGYWPAFWLLNAYYVDDKPEIDIMEFIGHNQDAVYATYHYYDANGELRSTKSHPTPGVDYTNGFHTYAVDWRPGVAVFYINGIEVHRITDAKMSRQEMYIIANTALGGWWAGSPDDTTPFPGEYTLDYIRVYQRNTPFDDVLLNDGITNVPFADDVPGQNSPSHRPPFELWPEGYPDGL